MSDRWLWSLDRWIEREPDMPSLGQIDDDEDARARKWEAFESECRDFAASEPDGFAAVLRAVANALKEQE